MYSFEPKPGNFERINKIVKANNFSKKTKVFNIGLGDKNSKMDFDYNENDRKNNSNSFNAWLIDNGTGDIVVKKFDDIVKKEKINNIGFIKIDVEGFEVKFLKGASEFFRDNKPIIYGEFTPNQISDNGDDPKFIFDFFSDYVFSQETKTGFNKLNKYQDFKRDLLLVPKSLEIDI